MSHHEDPSRELASLREDMAKIRSELSGIRSSLKDLRKSGDGGGASAESGAAGRVRQAWDGVRERGRHSVEAVEHRVEERPFLSMLTVLGTGLIVGRLLGFVPLNFRSALESDESAGPVS